MRPGWTSFDGARPTSRARSSVGWRSSRRSTPLTLLEGAAEVEPARAALRGLELGPYRLVEPIGHGGMGTVWLAARADGRFEDLHSDRGDTTAAVADAERRLALEVARLGAGSTSSMLGRAYLAVARARMAAGRTRDALDAAQQAQRHLDAALGADHRDAVATRDLLRAPP